MKKQLFILLSACLLIICNSYSQNISIDYGNSIPGDAKNLNPIAFIGKDNNFLYFLKKEIKLSGRPDYIVEKYSIKDRSRIFSKELEFDCFSFNKVILLKDKLYLITNESEKDHHILFATEIGKNGQLTSNKNKIAEANFKDLGSNYDNGSFQIFRIKMNADNSTLYAFPSSVENGTIQLFIVDGNLNITEKSIPIELSDASMIDMEIQGDIAFALLKTPIKKQKFDDDQPILSFSCATINLKNYNLSFSPFELNNQMKISSCKIISDNKKNIFLVGFYNSGKESSSDNKGMFCTKMNTSNGKKIIGTELDYDAEMIGSLNYPRDKGLTKKGLIKEVKIQNIIAKDDGGIIVLMEKNYVGSHGDYLAYVADNVVIFYFNNKMELERKSIVPKAQQGDSFGEGKFNSYFPIYKDKKIYLIYNENPENLHGTTNGKTKRSMLYRFGGKSDLTIDNITIGMMIIEEDGTWKKEELMKYTDAKPYLMPTFNFPISKNESIIYTERQGEIRLATIKY